MAHRSAVDYAVRWLPLLLPCCIRSRPQLHSPISTSLRPAAGAPPGCQWAARGGAGRLWVLPQHPGPAAQQPALCRHAALQVGMGTVGGGNGRTAVAITTAPAKCALQALAQAHTNTLLRLPCSLCSAPECILGLGGCEADVWSAGVLLYHLLSERFPFCDPRHNISQVWAGAGPGTAGQPALPGGVLHRTAHHQVLVLSSRAPLPASLPSRPTSSHHHHMHCRASTGGACRSSPSTLWAPPGTACRPAPWRCSRACWIATAAGEAQCSAF